MSITISHAFVSARVAKDRGLRLFKGYNASAASKKKMENSFSAKVIKIMSGESVVLLNGKGKEMRVFLSSIRQPKYANGPASNALSF